MQKLQETQVLSLGWEDPLEKWMATHPTLAWRIPCKEEPGGARVHRVTKSRTRLKRLNTQVRNTSSQSGDSDLVWHAVGTKNCVLGKQLTGKL